MAERTKKKFIVIVIWGMLLVGAILLSAPKQWFPDFYTPRFMGVGALLFAVIIFLPQIFFRTSGQHKDFQIKKNVILNLQVILAVCFLLAGLGELGLWKLYLYGFEYDKFVHFLVPMMLTISGSHLLFHWWGLKRKNAVLVTALLVFIGSLAWEALEFYSDRIFGTQLFGVYGQNLSGDTIWDVVFDILGISIGWLVARGKLRR
ncbi:MAG: hypothetical protein KW806_02690 [Candidatus Yanofskybacteria bacterium]|nr:hypothetical protein [Candidatus Yanofskybacteria bacterium]